MPERIYQALHYESMAQTLEEIGSGEPKRMVEAGIVWVPHSDRLIRSRVEACAIALRHFRPSGAFSVPALGDQPSLAMRLRSRLHTGSRPSHRVERHRRMRH